MANDATKHAADEVRELLHRERVSGPHSLTADEMGALEKFRASMFTRGQARMVPASYGWDIFADEHHEDGAITTKWIAGLTEELPIGNRSGVRLYPTRQETRANAARLVNAWNAHDLLLEAIELLLEVQNGPPLLEYADRYDAAVSKAAHAIAKARGGAA